MIEDLHIWNSSPQAIKGYVYHEAQCAKHFRNSPDLLVAEKNRQYRVHLPEGEEDSTAEIKLGAA